MSTDARMSRRQLISTGAAAGAGLAAAMTGASRIPLAEAKASKPKPNDCEWAPLLPPSRIGLWSYSISDAINSMGFARVFEKVAQIGYQEIGLTNYTQGTGSIKLKQIRRLLRDNGLVGVSAHAQINDDASADKAGHDAAVVGLPYVGLSIYIPQHGTTVSGWQQTADDFNRWGALTAKSGVRFFLHTHGLVEFSPCADQPTTRAIDVLLRETDPKLFVFTLDTFWSYAAAAAYTGFDPLDYVRAHPKRFPMFHVKDARRDQTGHYNPNDITDVGQGHIDFQRFFSDPVFGDRKGHHYQWERDNASSHPRGSLASAECSYLYMRYALHDFRARRRCK